MNSIIRKLALMAAVAAAPLIAASGVHAEGEK